MSWECRDWLFSLDWRDLRKQTQMGAQQTVRVLAHGLFIHNLYLRVQNLQLPFFLLFFIPSVSLFLFSLS
jgi:hypothetical protein